MPSSICSHSGNSVIFSDSNSRIAGDYLCFEINDVRVPESEYGYDILLYVSLMEIGEPICHGQVNWIVTSYIN